jgi:hypothetical protein
LKQVWTLQGNINEHKAKARATDRSFSTFGWRQSPFCHPSPSLNTVRRTCLQFQHPPKWQSQ